MAGWLSITFLDNPTSAKLHFQKIWDISSRPISKARAAFWIGKSYEDLGIKEESIKWYKEASIFSLTYYGQLAATKLSPTRNFSTSIK